MAKMAHTPIAKAPDILVSKQATEKNQREAIDQLQSQMSGEGRGKKVKKLVSYDELQTLTREQLEALVKDHPQGASITGWKPPFEIDDPRSMLLEYQHVVSSDESRFKAALQARQSGKDFGLNKEIAQDMFEHPGTRWMTAAPSERQSLDSLEQGKLWCRAFGEWIESDEVLREGPTEQHLLKSAEIKLANGSTAIAVPGRPETVRGKSTNVAITEVDFLENPKETVRALLPSILNPMRGGEKKLRYISTPNGVGNMMHKVRTQADGKMRWSHHTVNILQAILMGLPVDFEVMMEMFGDDQEGARQELLCEFLDGSNVLLPYDLIQASESMEATEVWDPMAALLLNAPTYTGIDFGRQNDPTVAWTLQRIGGCLWTREVLVLEKTSTPDQDRILADRVSASTRTCEDYTGPGIGLGDLLVERHGQWDPESHQMGKVELCTFTAQFKRELFPNLRRGFEASMPGSIMAGRKALPLRVPVSTVIREDLHQTQQIITNGQYNYWSPRTKNGHSDRCTALALAYRAASTGGGLFQSQGVKPNRRGRAGKRLIGWS
jgi:phage FluMu gp28-like protein